MHLIDGKALAARVRAETKAMIEDQQLRPHLGVILVGQDPASHLYVNLKKKHALEVGIRVTIKTFEATSSDEEILKQIEAWNQDTDVHGILLQLPLPFGHDEKKIVAAIDPAKDADGFHPKNLERLEQGEFTILSPLIEGCLRLIAQTPLRLSGAKTVIIANSDIFALPFEHMLRKAGAFVTIMSPDEIQKSKLKDADLIVIAIGRPRFLHASMTKDDAVIIDIGTNREGEKTVGDVDRESYENTDAWLTPVPGGVGPMTIAQLLKNVAMLSSSSS